MVVVLLRCPTAIECLRRREANRVIGSRSGEEGLDPLRALPPQGEPAATSRARGETRSERSA